MLKRLALAGACAGVSR